VREKLLVVIVLELNGKGEGEEIACITKEARAFPLVLISVVIDALSHSMPACAFLHLLFVAETQDLHAVIIE